jgi:hypothetical protein
MPQSERVLSLLEQRMTHLPVPIRGERLVTYNMLLTSGALTN